MSLGRYRQLRLHGEISAVELAALALHQGASAPPLTFEFRDDQGAKVGIVRGRLQVLEAEEHAMRVECEAILLLEPLPGDLIETASKSAIAQIARVRSPQFQRAKRDRREKRVPPVAERDKGIREAYYKGARVDRIAKTYKMSEGEVWQIVGAE